MRIPLRVIAQASCDGRVYQAFGHYVAAAVGSVFAVPSHHALPDGTAVVPGLPVPLDDVLELLDPLTDAAVPCLLARDPHCAWLLQLAAEDWDCDLTSRLIRYAHPSGLRYARLADDG